MLRLTTENQFKRIAYAFFSTFSQIEAITLSFDDRNNCCIDFWKTNELTSRYGVYEHRTNNRWSYTNIRNRNRTGLFSSLKVITSFNHSDENNFFVERDDVMCQYKNNNVSFTESEAKEKMKKIAKLLNLDKIIVEDGNVFTFVDDDRDIQRLSFRGAGGLINYRGDLNYLVTNVLPF